MPVLSCSRNPSDAPIGTFLSHYLDLWRIIAAFMVFTMHLFLPQLNIYPVPGNGSSPFLHGQAHLAVIVFFVLSGYLISHSIHKKQITPGKFALDRSVRLYAVIIPSILLSAAVSCVAPQISPHWASGFLAEPMQPARYLLNLVNCQQLWFLCVAPGVNWAFWSLGYEAWFYVLLAMFVFLKGRERIIILSLAGLLIGPKILLLFPSWLFGVLAERLTAKHHSEYRNSVWKVGFFSTLILIIIVLLAPESLPLWNHGSSFGHRPWFYSANAAADSFFAILVAANFLCAGKLGDSNKIIPNNCRKPIRWIAQRTYSLYLYHTPLLFLVGWLIPHHDHHVGTAAFLAVAVLGSVTVLAHFTEFRTPDLKRFIVRGLFSGTLP